MRKPGLKDIAKAAGCSAATVSDVLNGKTALKRIAPATDQKIRAIAKELGYRPNLLAKSLVQSRSRAIGLVYQELTFSFADALTAAVMARVEKEGYTAFIATSQWDPARERREIDSFLDRCIEGAITVPLLDNNAFYRDLPGYFPLVQVCDRLEGVDLPSVMLDAAGAIREIVAHLHGLGHRKIGFIGVRSESVQLGLRYEGFLQACADFGLSMDRQFVEFGRNTDAASIRDAGLTMLSGKNPPTAIVCVSDPVAMQLMEGLCETRYAGAVAIAGIGDSMGCGSRLIQLTSVSEPLAEIGRIAADLLLDMIAGRPLESRQHLVRGQLMPRRSTLSIPPPRKGSPINS